LTTLIVDQNIITIGGDVGDDEVLHHEIGVEVVSRRTLMAIERKREATVEIFNLNLDLREGVVDRTKRRIINGIGNNRIRDRLMGCISCNVLFNAPRHEPTLINSDMKVHPFLQNQMLPLFKQEIVTSELNINVNTTITNIFCRPRQANTRLVQLDVLGPSGEAHHSPFERHHYLFIPLPKLRPSQLSLHEILAMSSMRTRKSILQLPRLAVLNECS
jgi:hypothetical protein